MGRDRLILEAAEEQFYERSFDGVGVAAIGARAGVSPSAIYRHFESKDEILAVLFDEAMDALQRHTADVHPDPKEELAYLIAGHAEFALTHVRLAAIWTRERRALAEPYRRRVQRRQKQYIDRWIECLGACYPGWRRSDLAVITRAVLAMMTSDGTRPSAVPRSAHLKELLVSAATNAVQALERYPIPNRSDAWMVDQSTTRG
ncbi:TetR/AcrR family transcriptional regulator [Rhodococcus opacus]|uniref:TetR/AcrR family transcriptional regulator n=1 Tax=Rhodococcus opacus TaxID=37919 RepID=UPI0024770BC4|nr:TetR/AcrR family transcriptional regulator [Rhodococcus opacus]